MANGRLVVVVVVEPDSSRVLQETTSNNGLPPSLFLSLRGTRGQERWSDIRHNFSPVSSTRLSAAVTHTKHISLPLSPLSTPPARSGNAMGKTEFCH